MAFRIIRCGLCGKWPLLNRDWLRSEIKKHYMIVDKEEENDNLR